MNLHALTLTFLAVAMVATQGCATTATGAKPHDMSAKDHEAAAKEHAARAQNHADQYSPEATRVEQVYLGYLWSNGEQEHFWPTDLEEDGWLNEKYNPTQKHSAEAEEHQRHADQHRGAAEKLRSFEAAECRAFLPETREVCPLLGAVASVENIEGGVRIEVKEGTPPEAVYMHMRCHHAFGSTHGHEGMEHCPMYMKAIKFDLTRENKIEMTTSNEDGVLELRTRARAHQDS